MSAGKPLVAHILAGPPNQSVFAERAAEMRFCGRFLAFSADRAVGCAKSDGTSGHSNHRVSASACPLRSGLPMPVAGRSRMPSWHPLSACPLRFGILPALASKARLSGTGSPELHHPSPCGTASAREARVETGSVVSVKRLREPHEVVRRDVFGADGRRQVERGVGPLHRGVSHVGFLAASHP